MRLGIGLCTAAVLASHALPLAAQGVDDLPNRPITRSEVTRFVTRQFAEMDRNHDGVVTRDEFRDYQDRADRQPNDRGSDLAAFNRLGSRWFDRTDAKGDGRITLAEAMARPLHFFDLADTNGDGVVSVGERQVAAMVMALTGE